MKKLIVLMFCFCGFVWAQDTTEGNRYASVVDSSKYHIPLKFNIVSDYTIAIWFDFSTDTLKIYCDLPCDEAAKLFLEAVSWEYGAKCDSLKSLKEELKIYRKYFDEIDYILKRRPL